MTTRVALEDQGTINETLRLSAVEQARLIRDRRISSRELIQAHLNRIAQVNPKLNAAIMVLGDDALRAADQADQRAARGETISPLDGVPFTVKDSIEVAGTACTAGTIGLTNSPPSKSDATLVSRLRSAGAIPIAKTNLPDLLFAFETDNLIFGRTNNPYDVTRTCGGSSGGEAALIAACASPMGLGSDAAGSVRLPAHFCGIASIKPTSGRLARTGHVPPAGGWIEMLWQIGPMARHAADLRAMMPILIGPDGRDHTVIDVPYQDPNGVRLRDLRVAFFTDNGIIPADSETAATVRAAAQTLAGDGAEVDETRPPGIDQSFDLEMKMIGPDGGDGLRQFLQSVGSKRTHPLLEQWLAKLERYRTNIDGFAEYWNNLHEFRARMNGFMQNYDVILSPVYPTPALKHGASTLDENFIGFSYTMTHNLTGWPAAVVRCSESAAGLPIGIQIAARPLREDIALAVASRLEQVKASTGVV
ncbi:MAG: amidase [Blastocatellia bacterium]|nr:amidase [Blastocatellia bacterium]